MIELVRRLDPRRWEVHVACFHSAGAWLSRAAVAAASMAAFPVTSFKSTGALAQMRAFAAWCRERELVVVHTSELYSNILFLPGAALARVPVRIGSRREIVTGKTRPQLALQRAAYACAHRVVANARAAAAQLALERVPAHKVAVVPNGLHVEHFTPRALPSSLRRVAMVANLRPEKGQDVLIDAVPEVLRRFPDARFDLIGDGSERAALERRARERGVADAVSFLGHREDVAALLAASDIFVLPSRSEAFPNALLEAMAAGIPVVASAVGGVTEIVEDERNGLLVPPGDAGALARQICRLMDDSALATTLADNARTLVQTRFSFDRMVAAIDDIYVSELTRRAGVGAAQSQFASL